MREPGLWLVTAGAGLVAFFVGSGLEQNAIATDDNFGGPAVLIAHGIAVVLGCVAAYQWRRAPRRQPANNAGPGVATWQGYCIALLSVVWIALAAVTWFLTELKSPTLMLSMLGIALMHLVGGRAVVRQNHARGPAREPSSGRST